MRTFKFLNLLLLLSVGVFAGCSQTSHADWKDFGGKLKRIKTRINRTAAKVSDNKVTKQAKAVQQSEIVQGVINSQRTLTPEEEYFLGRAVAANVLATHSLADTESVNDYLNRMGQFLALHSSRPQTFRGYRFALVNSDRPLATSAPGGFVFVSRALLQQIKFEDELAAVLAHEIAHIALRHAEAAIQKSHLNKIMGKAGGKLAGEVSDTKFAAIVSDAATGALNRAHSRGDEIAADHEAVRILARSGYNPYALSYFLRRHKVRGGWNSTHPTGAKRIAELQEALSPHHNKKLPRERSQRLQRSLASVK